MIYYKTSSFWVHCSCNGTKVVVKEDDGGKWMIVVVEKDISSSLSLEENTLLLLIRVCVLTLRFRLNARRWKRAQCLRDLRKWTSSKKENM